MLTICQTTVAYQAAVLQSTVKTLNIEGYMLPTLQERLEVVHHHKGIVVSPHEPIYSID